MTQLANRLLLRREFIEAAEMDGEWVLLDLDSHSITKLNEMGGYIWEQLEQYNTIQRLAEKIASDFEVEQEHAASDVEAFIAELMRVGLISYGE